MEADNDLKTYELAYHLNPDLEEVDVRVRTKEMIDLITQSNGSILTSTEPRKIHLSYPIKNKQYAYFGVASFKALPEIIEKINAQLKLQDSIIRFLLLTKPDAKTGLRILGEFRARPRLVKTHEASAETLKEPVKEKTKEEVEQLEKDIEKVIEGL